MTSGIKRIETVQEGDPDSERAGNGSERTTDSDGGRWRPRLRKAAAVFGTLLLIAVVLPFVIFAVPQAVGADHGFVILSGSMEPGISAGDAVIVDASRTIEVGDVITFEDDGEIPTTHRVIGVENGLYVTQGDANEEPDDRLVDPDSVLGEVVVTIPLIGYIIVWVNSPLGYLALVGIPLALLLGTELRAWHRRRNDTAAPDGADDATAEDVATLRPAIRWRGDQQARAEKHRVVTVRTARRQSDEFVRANGHGGPDVEAATDDSAEQAAPTVAVAVADLKLSMLATGVLFVYAAWHVWLAFAAGAAPHPVSVGAMTAGLLGLALTVWVTASAWHAARQREPTPTSAPEAPVTDGGTDRSGP